jgi:DNA-binding CsgD family transcriptional regulator
MTQRLPQQINRSLLARLDREWHALNHRPAVLHRVAGWGLGIDFNSLDDVVVAAGYWTNVAQRQCAGGEGSAAANEVLRRLLLAARTDDVAARVALQRVLPGVMTAARRWGAHRAGGSVDAFDEMLSATWMAIREFPVESRSGHLAAGILRAGEYRAFQQQNRRMMVHEPTAPNLLDLAVEPLVTVDVADELAELLATAEQLTEYDLQLLELLASGCTAIQISQALKISERTVRNHRDSIVVRLRSAAMAALAA